MQFVHAVGAHKGITHITYLDILQCYVTTVSHFHTETSGQSDGQPLQLHVFGLPDRDGNILGTHFDRL
ncbi:MAG: hypothetical protein ABS92_03085 [Thiobacillus sp. SCN 63-374]|nr:MAG: hypothetical protein ABS92_03085 [Thiobacillus sp. SCN 63-374]